MISATFTATGRRGTPRLKSPGTPKSDCDLNKEREKGMNEGRMARLDPYLGQPLKEIVPNADGFLIFVSHGTILQDERRC